MFEVHVLSHPHWDDSDKLIYAVKMFRMVTHLPLKECKDAIEDMMGKKWDLSLPIERRIIRYERKPFIMKANTFIRAMQIKIEFTNCGFTAEVVETNGQGS